MSPPNRPPKLNRTDAGLHWDRNPFDPPSNLGVQGVLYLTDTPANQGAFTCVPGFHHKIEEWLETLPEDADPRRQDLESLGAEPVPGKAGDLIIWHSSLPHGAGPNFADQPRVVQYITMFPAGEGSEESRAKRIDAWRTRGAGFSGERAEKEFTEGKTAKLTPLGRKLLGLEKWRS